MDVKDSSETAVIVDAANDVARLREENAKLARRVAELERKISLQPQTGLPTHFRLELELEEMIDAHRRHCDRKGFTVLIVQLGDNYSIVRKTLKASVSEWILYQTGCRIASLLRSEDRVFHTRENEFVLLLPNIKGQVLADFLNKLIARLSEPHIFSGFNVAIKTAMGASYWPEHGEERSAILHRADIAAGAAVEERKPFVLFRAELLMKAVERVELQNSIIRAIESAGSRDDALGDQFTLYYQPKLFCDFFDGEVLHVSRIEAEALIRWRHPEKGMILPDKFIPLAEETGLILPMGKWLIYQCARRLAAWDAEGRKTAGISMNLSINLSARQFHSQDAADILASALASTGVSPERFTIELTETSLFEDPEETSKTLARFSDLGVRISVDDFGTGYSSLSHLHRFPLNEIKIDRLFIEGLTTSRQDKIIVSSLISIAKGLGLNLVAEGVEKLDALKMLWEMGCTGFQGFIFAPAMPPDDFAAYCDSVEAKGMRIRP